MVVMLVVPIVQLHVAGTVQVHVNHLVLEVALAALLNQRVVTILAKILVKKPVQDLHLVAALVVTTHVQILAAKAVPMIALAAVTIAVTRDVHLNVVRAVPMIVQVAVTMVATRDVHLNVAKDVLMIVQMDVVMVVKRVVKQHVL